MLGKIFNHSPSIIYRGIKEAMQTTHMPDIASDIKEIELDEMWHFLKKKVKNSGSSRPWTFGQGEQLPGDRHITYKSGTVTKELDNSNTSLGPHDPSLLQSFLKKSTDQKNYGAP